MHGNVICEQAVVLKRLVDPLKEEDVKDVPVDFITPTLPALLGNSATR